MTGPERLIDPEGEGVYFRSWPPGNPSALTIAALEFYGDSRLWRDLDSEFVWMREGEDGNWYRDRWRRRYVPKRRTDERHADSP